MRYLLYQLFEKINRYRIFLSSLDVSITLLSLILGLSVFVGFVVVKQQDLSFSLQDIRSKAQQGKESVVVQSVIDGDTVQLADGRVVRYIGIDAPESSECMFEASKITNQDLVEGKKVRLEKDISDIDKYGRLLRYVWVEDTLVNELLVAKGLARSMPIQPDIKYSAKFVNAYRQARESNLGIWGDCD